MSLRTSLGLQMTICRQSWEVSQGFSANMASALTTELHTAACKVNILFHAGAEPQPTNDLLYKG